MGTQWSEKGSFRSGQEKRCYENNNKGHKNIQNTQHRPIACDSIRNRMLNCPM